MVEQKQVQKNEDFEEIVRIMSRDVYGTKSLIEGLKRVTGIGHSFANAVISKTKFSSETKIGTLKEDDIKAIEAVVKNPEKNGIPAWIYNRRKDPHSGDNKHLTEAEREFTQKFDIRKMRKIKSYKGLRHGWGLPVRGQRTKTSFRKGGKIGVSKTKPKTSKPKM